MIIIRDKCRPCIFMTKRYVDLHLVRVWDKLKQARPKVGQLSVMPRVRKIKTCTLPTQKGKY